ncbi:MAG: hypothetical protein ABIA63_11860 [bacterium]
MNIAFYITGHGLGHISRQTLVIREILKIRPVSKIFIRSKAHSWYIKGELGDKVHHTPVACDTGVRQIDSLQLLKYESLKDFHTFYKNRTIFYKQELSFIRKNKISLIVTDFSHFAMELAGKAGIPCIGITNFTWDYIYEQYTAEYPEFAWIPGKIREMHKSCTEVFRLPFNHVFKGFKKIADIPMIAHFSAKKKKAIKAELCVPRNKKCVLISFGGFSIQDFSSDWIRKQNSYFFMANETSNLSIPGLINFNFEFIKKSGLEYCDLVKAADVVVTKPGYGIISECLANKTGIIYTSRGPFREYSRLVKHIKKYLHGVYITPGKVKTGDLEEALHTYFKSKHRIITLPSHGAKYAAQKILAMDYTIQKDFAARKGCPV